MLKLDEDPTKTKVQTRDGRPAKIYAVYTQKRGIHGAVQNPDGEWAIINWLHSGFYFSDDNEVDWDLVNQPPPAVEVTGWAVVAEDGEYFLTGNISEKFCKEHGITGYKRVTVTVTPGVF